MSPFVVLRSMLLILLDALVVIGIIKCTRLRFHEGWWVLVIVLLLFIDVLVSYLGSSRADRMCLVSVDVVLRAHVCAHDCLYIRESDACVDIVARVVVADIPVAFEPGYFQHECSRF